MKKSLLHLFFIGIVIVGASFTVSAQKKTAKPKAAAISGIYENFTVGKESGDLEGMRVRIINAGNAYHAVVQIAQGGAEDPAPVFVPVEVTGTNIEFTVGETTYKGKITTAGITFKDEEGHSRLVKRQPCSF